MENSQTYLTKKQESDSCWTNRSRSEKRLLLWIIVLVPLVLGLAIAIAVMANDYRLMKLRFGENEGKTKNDSNESSICTTPLCVETASSILLLMNASSDPCENFHMYACGNWEEEHPMPDEKGRYGQFDVLDEKIMQKYKGLLSDAFDDDDTNATKKTKILYTGCVKEDAVFNTTLPGVLEVLESWGGWPIMRTNWTSTNFDWIAMQASFIRYPPTPKATPSAIVDFAVSFDMKNTTRNIIIFDQPSLGLGRDFLLKPENFSFVVKSYKNLIKDIALSLGRENKLNEDNVNLDIEDMIALETNIAKISLPPAQRRDRYLTYNNMTLRELNSLTRNQIDWLRFTRIMFANIAEIDENEMVDVMDKNYVIQMVDLINSTSKRTLSNYMLWRYLTPLLIHTSRETQTYAYDFAKIMTGATRANPRWKTCAVEVDKSLGMALGSMFVRKYFSENSKSSAEEMINDIRVSFGKMLTEVDWMDADTRTAALEKAAKMTQKIGYPDWILNPKELDAFYENVSITADSHFKNLASAAEKKTYDQLQSLREIPADKSKWYMTPGTVNAYYTGEINSINFPAGILQEPFFADGRAKSLNFGAIGAVIGHEITHGFDDQGRLYDKDGNLKEWMKEDSVKNFQKKAQCYVSQYSRYCPPELNGICLNGNLTLGENIADNGGIKAAFKAYKAWKETNGQEQLLPGLENFTSEQLFFLSFAQVWCAKSRQETMRNLVFKDPHSPPAYRILGTLSNSEEFAATFKCNERSAMNRGSDRCVLW